MKEIADHGEFYEFTRYIFRFHLEISEGEPPNGGSAMNFAFGVALIIVAFAMIWLGRPKSGEESRSWLRSYAVGQLYVMSTMACGVFGVSLLMNYWPA